VLLFENEEYKEPIFRNYNIGKKIVRASMLKNRLKTDYDTTQGLI
jgi:hypothetical protein